MSNCDKCHWYLGKAKLPVCLLDPYDGIRKLKKGLAYMCDDFKPIELHQEKPQINYLEENKQLRADIQELVEALKDVIAYRLNPRKQDDYLQDLINKHQDKGV